MPLSISLLVAAVAVATACGSDRSEPPPARTAAASTEASKQAQHGLLPPSIYLGSRAGRQRAVPGKSCVLTVGQGRGEGAADCYIPRGRVVPKVVSVVRPGAPLTVLLPGTTIIRRPGCVGRHECGGWATLRPLGCQRREVAFFPLRGRTTRWRANVPVGAYQLDVSIDFETANDLTGDANGVLGVLVEDDRREAIVPFRPSLAVCGAG